MPVFGTTSGVLTTSSGTLVQGIVQLTTYATLNGQSIDLTVYEDTTGDGTADNQQTVAVKNGDAQTYELDNLSKLSGSTYWCKVAMSTSTPGTTPSIRSFGLDVVDAWNTETEYNNAQSRSGIENSPVSGRSGAKLRLGGTEDDGDVAEFDTTDVAGTYSADSANTKVGQYARKMNSGTGTDDYERVIRTLSATISPGLSEVWLYIPKPGNGNWVTNYIFQDGSGNTITRAGFDGANKGGIALLNPSSGWTSAGSYPANTWFRIQFDWDWANNQFDFYADGTQRVTGHGFRNAASGYTQTREAWDYNVGNVTGYIDGEYPLHIGSGSLVTGKKTS